MKRPGILSKKQWLTRRVWPTLAVPLLLVAFAILATAYYLIRPNSPASRISTSHNASAEHVTTIHEDHPVFATRSELVRNSDYIVVGIVQSVFYPETPIIGTDPYGKPVADVPHTHYTVSVKRILRVAGNLRGSTITVVVVGGKTNDGYAVAEGIPSLKIGSKYLFFLRQSDNGKYFPVAGNTAIGQPVGDKYIVPAEATGASPLEVTEAELAT
jgi:hypothetical protein